MPATDYERLRAAGWRALDAYRATRPRPPSLLDELDIDHAVTWTAAPWTLRASVEHDDYQSPGDMGYGYFTDDEDADTIPADTNGPREWKHFRPDYSIAERVETYTGRYHGMTRATARERAQAEARYDMLRARDSYPAVVTVTASRAGVELGRASVAGVEMNPDPALPYGIARSLIVADLREAVDELTREALAEANATLPAVIAALQAAIA